MRLLLTGMCAAACVALLPVAGAVAELRLTPSLRLAETFSDNVDQNPEGQETSAFLSDVAPALNLRWQAARVTAAADASATFRHQTDGADKGVQVLPSLGSFGTVEVSRELFFVDGSASISQEVLDTRENDTESNRDSIQNYSVSPYLVNAFGGFADGELRYTLDQILNSGERNLSDETTHSVSASLDSGTDFTRLRWSLGASASESSRSDNTSNNFGGGGDVSRRDASLGLEYAVARWLSLIGSGGYQQFDDGDPANEVDGPSWDAGIILRPSPRTELRATYGRRDGEQSLAAEMTHRIGPRTTISASYAERLETGQERIIRDLQFIDVDPDTGELIDSRSGLPFDPNSATTSLTDETTRTKTFRATLRGTRGRNAFQVTSTVQTSKGEGGVSSSNEEESGYGVSASWQRRLNPRTNLNVFGSYGRNEFTSDDRTDNQFDTGGTLSYLLYRNIDAFTSYSFAKQTSTDAADEYIENRVSVGLQITF